jgi:hypothetical protein
MIKHILSYLLHHANRETNMEEFYKIKDKIITKYGKGIGHDVQFIEGKKCRSCGGFGYHRKYSWETGKVYDTVDCYHCWWGWYKQPTWVLLERIRFGKYIFHKPVERKYGSKNPFDHIVNNPVIEGYIDHTRSKYGKDALVILFLLYDWKGYWKRWYCHIGTGWYWHWSWIYTPRKWPNNIAHLIRCGRKAIPFMKLKKCEPPEPEHAPWPEQTGTSVNTPIEDLPF